MNAPPFDVICTFPVSLEPISRHVFELTKAWKYRNGKTSCADSAQLTQSGYIYRSTFRDTKSHTLSPYRLSLKTHLFHHLFRLVTNEIKTKCTRVWNTFAHSTNWKEFTVAVCPVAGITKFADLFTFIVACNIRAVAGGCGRVVGPLRTAGSKGH